MGSIKVERLGSQQVQEVQELTFRALGFGGVFTSTPNSALDPEGFG